MTGSLADQVALVANLERYERGERLALWFPQVRCLGIEADARHQQMFESALRCGFEPGRGDSYVTCLSWSRQRAALIVKQFPKHTRAA